MDEICISFLGEMVCKLIRTFGFEHPSAERFPYGKNVLGLFLAILTDARKG
jgi:hypothetical protein